MTETTKVLGRKDFSKETMDATRELGKSVSASLPPGNLWLIIVANEGEDGRLYYLSNMERDGAIKLLEEHIKHLRENAPTEE